MTIHSEFADATDAGSIAVAGDDDPPGSASVLLKARTASRQILSAGVLDLVPAKRVTRAARRTLSGSEPTDQSTAFRRRFFPTAKLSDWND
ncbi:MAG: hypothetical protein WAO83_01985 [Fuerstiella sp.]